MDRRCRGRVRRQSHGCLQREGFQVRRALATNMQHHESVSSFMADPCRNECFSRAPNRAGSTAISIETSVAPENVTTKIVYIKITGSRADSRSRSASPILQGDTGPRRGAADWSLLPLPHGIYVDAVPQIHRRHGDVEYLARIRPISLHYEAVNDRAIRETGQAARELNWVDLGRRVPERDVSNDPLHLSWS